MATRELWIGYNKNIPMSRKKCKKIWTANFLYLTDNIIFNINEYLESWSTAPQLMNQAFSPPPESVKLWIDS
jgi:hypothetical protein